MHGFVGIILIFLFMTSMMMMTMMVIVIAGYCVVLFTCSGFVVTV